jgi:hypothetical protein
MRRVRAALALVATAVTVGPRTADAALTAACEAALSRAVTDGCLVACATAGECNAVPVNGVPPPPPPPPPIADNAPCMPATAECKIPGFGDVGLCNARVGCLWDDTLEPLVAKCTGSTEAGCDALPGCAWELTESGMGDCSVPPPPAPPPVEEGAPPPDFTACELTKGCTRREATDEFIAGCAAAGGAETAPWYGECQVCQPGCQTFVDEAYVTLRVWWWYALIFVAPPFAHPPPRVRAPAPSIRRYVACAEDSDFTCEVEGCACPEGLPGCPDSTSVQGLFKQVVEEQLKCDGAQRSAMLGALTLLLPVLLWLPAPWL